MKSSVAEAAPGAGGHDNDINQMERPDEKDLRENPMILSLTQSVGDLSFIDDR